jgi:TldD protein
MRTSFEHKINYSIVLEEIIKTATKAVNVGVGIRVISGEKTGYAYSEGLDRPFVLKAARTAAFIASSSSDGGKVKINVPRISDHNLYTVPLLSTDIGIQEKIALLREADAAARAFDPRIQQVQTSYIDETKHVLIVTSDGRSVWDVQPMVRFNVSCILKRTERDIGYQEGGRLARNFQGQSQSTRWQMKRHDDLQLGAIDAPAGTMEVVLGNGWPGILLHEAIGHGLEADFNRKQTSAFTGLWNRPWPPIVHRGGRLLSIPPDSPTSTTKEIPQNTVLIERGVERLSSGSPQFKALTCSVTEMAAVRDTTIFYSVLTNTFLMAGESAPEDIIRSVKALCRSFRWQASRHHQRKICIPLSEAYLIEDGKVTAPVKGNANWSGPTVLREVTMVGNDLKLDQGVGICGKEGQSVPVSVGLPYKDS